MAKGALLSRSTQMLNRASIFESARAGVCKLDPKRDTAENQELALASGCQAMLSSNAFLYVD